MKQRPLGEFGRMVVGKRIGDDMCGGGGGDADQTVEDEANLFTSRASRTGLSDELSITKNIGVAYALVGISSSVVAIDDMVG